MFILKTYEINENNFKTYKEDEEFLQAEEIYITTGVKRYGSEELILESYTINSHQRVKVIHISNVSELFRHAIYACPQLKEIICEDDILKSLPDGSISDCSCIEKVSLHEGLVTCSTFACTSLRSIQFPSTVRDITRCCDGCVLLESAVLPEGLTVIGGKAFFGCTNLQTVQLVDTIEVIECNAFSDCIKLSLFTLESSGFVYQDNFALAKLVNCRIIGDYAFSCCTSLSVSFTVPFIEELHYKCFQHSAITGFSVSSRLRVLDNPFVGARKLQKLNFEKGVPISHFENLLSQDIFSDTEIRLEAKLRELQTHNNLNSIATSRRNKNLFRLEGEV